MIKCDGKIRQLTASEASNDEIERQRFEDWATTGLTPDERQVSLVRVNTTGKYQSWYTDDLWLAWQAALKNKRE